MQAGDAAGHHLEEDTQTEHSCLRFLKAQRADLI